MEIIKWKTLFINLTLSTHQGTAFALRCGTSGRRFYIVRVALWFLANVFMISYVMKVLLSKPITSSPGNNGMKCSLSTALPPLLCFYNSNPSVMPLSIFVSRLT